MVCWTAPQASSPSRRPGTPWRLPHQSTALSACFVGVSFYKTAEGDRLMTSMAQVFNELGDNPNAVTTMIQVLGQKPVAVWPREAALQKFVFPRPKR